MVILLGGFSFLGGFGDVIGVYMGEILLVFDIVGYYEGRFLGGVLSFLSCL